MIYTLDSIPAKLFFRINTTGELNLLSDTSLSESKLEELWQPILTYYQKNSGNKTKDTELELYKTIQSLNSRLVAIKNTVSSLRMKRDEELEQYLKSNGYQLTDQNYLEDLKRIDLLSETILLKIEKHNATLESSKNKSQGSLTFEEILIGYLSILGFGFKDANSITLLEYLALEKQVKNKIKHRGKGQ